MPPDKWQMIIYPDTTETTHLSYRYTQRNHTVDVCVCMCCKGGALYLQLLAFGGGDAVCILSWTHAVGDNICTWWSFLYLLYIKE